MSLRWPFVSPVPCSASFRPNALHHFFKGLTVGTLYLNRIFLMRTDLNLVQSAVFTGVAMIFAGCDSTLDAVVLITFVHDNLLCDFFSIIMPPVAGLYMRKYLNILFRRQEENTKNSFI